MKNLQSGHHLQNIMDLCISLKAEEDPLQPLEGRDFPPIHSFQQCHKAVKEAFLLEVFFCYW